MEHVTATLELLTKFTHQDFFCTFYIHIQLLYFLPCDSQKLPKYNELDLKKKKKKTSSTTLTFVITQRILHTSAFLKEGFIFSIET